MTSIVCRPFTEDRFRAMRAYLVIFKTESLRMIKCLLFFLLYCTTAWAQPKPVPADLDKYPASRIAYPEYLP
jgi:hypothetical protein